MLKCLIAVVITAILYIANIIVRDSTNEIDLIEGIVLYILYFVILICLKIQE